MPERRTTGASGQDATHSPRLRKLTPARARAGIDPRLDGRTLQDAIKDAIGERHSSLGGWWDDEAGWCVELLSPVREHFHGLTLELALAWTLVYLMTDELGIGVFAS